MENNAYYIIKRAKNEQIFASEIKNGLSGDILLIFRPQIYRAYITYWLVMILTCDSLNDTN